MKVHIVAYRQRWDYLSFIYYGVADNYEDIQDANTLSFEERANLYAPTGRELIIPDLPVTVKNEQEDQFKNLPFWAE